MPYILFIVVAFFVSALCGFFMIPQIMNFCKQKNLYDIPNARKVHKNAIPRLGGISFMPSMLLAFLIARVEFYSTSKEKGARLSQTCTPAQSN